MMIMAKRTTRRRITLSPMEVMQSGGEVLKRILLCPDGEVANDNGDPFTFDGASYLAILEQWGERPKQRCVIDYEHHTLGGDFAAPDGKAKAAGWIERFEYVPSDGLYAHVEWTTVASEEIIGGQYRYLSPAFYMDEDDRKVVGLHSAALTNKPAIREMPRVAAKQVDQGEENMLKQLRELLRPLCPDLTDQADEAGTLAALKTLLDDVGENRQTVEHVRGALALTTAARGETIRVALDTKLAASKTGTDEVAALKQQVETLRTSERERRGQAMIDEAVRCNRLKPNAKSFAEIKALALKDPDQAKLLIDMLPEVPPSGQMVSDGAPPLHGEDALIAEAMKAHDHNEGKAIAALQKRLIDEQVTAGYRKDAAIDRLAKSYPKIFGVAA